LGFPFLDIGKATEKVEQALHWHLVLSGFQNNILSKGKSAFMVSYPTP
jgi:hypothetical protein